MLITNQTTVDYWFGPMHLLAGVGETLSLDDTTDTSLYLTDDTVADAVNTLVQSGNVTVTNANTPFPRPTGVPGLETGDGSPQGKVYAGQGSLYLRRDNTGGQTAVFAKTSGVTFNTGWAAINDPWAGANQALGLQYSTFPALMANNLSSESLYSGYVYGCGIWLNAGSTLTNLVANITTAGNSISSANLAIYNSAGAQLAATAPSPSTFEMAGWAILPLSAPYTVPFSGFFYFAAFVYGTTPPAIAYCSSGITEASYPLDSVYPYFMSQTTYTSLPSSVTPNESFQAIWLGAS